jgi:hypothetical protein
MLLIKQLFIKPIKLKPINFEWLYSPFIHYLFLFMNLIIITLHIFDSKYNASLGSMQDGNKGYLCIKLKIVRKSNINIYIYNTGQTCEVKLNTWSE